MTPNRMVWEALRFRVASKRIDMHAGKGAGGYKSKEIRQALLYRETTGLCPICRSRPAIRQTCGGNECVSLWTIGRIPSYYQQWTWKE